MKIFNRNFGNKEHWENTESIRYLTTEPSVVLLQYIRIRLRQAVFQSRLEILVKVSCSCICLVVIMLMLSGRIRQQVAAAAVGMASTVCCIPLSRGANKDLENIVAVFKLLRPENYKL